MLQCPYCYALNPEDSEFCNRCGSSIAESHETLTSPLSSKVTEKGYVYFSPGDLFAERYLIIEEIGRGGMGVVYKAEDRILGINVALKTIHPLYSDSPYMVHRFKEEILLARSISHENVIRIHDIGETDDIKYISMDYIKGQNLRELMRISGMLTAETAAKISERICLALKAAHEKGVVHRDLKPQNIMIDSQGRALTMDFGLAKSMVTADKKYSKKIIGTPAYMSPEQAKGEETDQRSDIYSLGIIMYEMFTGKRPLKADSKEGYIRKHLKEKPKPPQDISPSVPAPLATIILKCLEKNKNRRYQSVQDVLEALKQLSSHPATIIPKRNKFLLRYWYVLLLLLLACLAGYLLLRDPVMKTSPVEETTSIPSADDASQNLFAVMKFENNTGDEDLDHWENALQYWLICDLNQSRLLRLVPHDILDQILDDHGESGEAAYSTDMLNSLAQEEGITHFLLASYSKVGDEYWISVMIREASRSELLGSILVEGQGQESFPVMVDDITLQVKKQLMLGDAEIAADFDADIGIITTQSPEAWRLYNAGYQLTHERRHEESINFFNEAIALDPDFAMAYKLLSDACWYTGRREESKKHLLKAVELLHRASEKERFLIKAQAANRIQNSIEETIIQYRALLDQYPLDQEGLKFLGSLYRFIEEWDLALICWEKLLNSNKKIERYLSIENVSWIFMTKGWYDKALEIALTYPDNWPNPERFHRYVANIHMCKKDYTAALAEVMKSLKMEPDNPVGIRMVGQIQLLNEEFGEAERTFSSLCENEELKTKANGRYWLALVYLTQGNYTKCLEQTELGLDITKDLSLAEERADFQWLRANIYLAMGKFAEAQKAVDGLYEYALEEDYPPLTKFALMYRGIVQAATGQLDAAEADLEKIKQLIEEDYRPKNRRYYDYLAGFIARKNGQYDKAVVHFQNAYALLPHEIYPSDNHAFFLDALASTYLEKRDLENALAVFKKISELSVGHLTWGDIYGRSYYHLGKIYQELNQDKNAEGAYQKFLSLWKESDADPAMLADANRELGEIQSRF
jgi:serine/threonine protein kinase/predicted Zn-dependent protease